VAVFLALGLGILVGTTVLDDSLVASLRRRTEQLQQQASDLRDQVDDDLRRVAAQQRFATDVQAFLLPNRITLQPVVIVTVEGADAAALDEAATVLDLSGARVVTTITVQQAMTGASGSDAQDLAALLGAPADTSPQDLMTQAADALAERLAAGAPRAADPQSDLLGQLLSGGFVVAPGLKDADLAGVGGPEQVVVAIGGGSAPAAALSEGFLAPLVADLVDRDQVTVAAEGSDPNETFIAATRDRTASGALVSIDGLDDPIGGTALVLGIDTATTTGEGGAWGVGDQAAQPLPPPPA
jgi:hypothetical protein